VGSIAVVHETLSLTLDEAVAFDDIADRLIAMVGDVASDAPGGSSSRSELERRGSFGLLPAAIATPLAMVLTELVHNAVEHGTTASGRVVVTGERREGTLVVTVADDGPGLPAGFDVDRSGSLGLQIVATLVRGELDGVLDLRNRPGGGTAAVVEIPLVGR
jgi:two-component sensor histidine kinase